jgi:D-tyrosyl-tRNA(Tyr) deacylase
MRAIIQRVGSASVAVEEVTVARIGHGYMVLVGISNGDTDADLEFILRKILSIRLFDSEEGKSWAKNVTEVGGSILLVSQFTLCHTLKGNKPDFHNAMTGSESRPMFDKLVNGMAAAYKAEKVVTGAFGEHMQVSLVNDGPVTITLDSRDRDGTGASPKLKEVATPKFKEGAGPKVKKEPVTPTEVPSVATTADGPQ